MRLTKVSSIVLLVIMSMTCFAVAQEPAQKSSTTENQQPKSEVDQALEETEKRGETVLSACLKDCEGEERQVIGGFEQPRVLVLAKPSYPPIARAAHAQGEVEVKVLLDFDGKVIAASAISGHPLLQATSVKAARASEFSVAKLNGKPVKVVGVIRYNFHQ